MGPTATGQLFLRLSVAPAPQQVSQATVSFAIFTCYHLFLTIVLNSVKRSERGAGHRHSRDGSNSSDDAEDSDEPESEEGVDMSENGQRHKVPVRNHAKAMVEAEASAARRRVEAERRNGHAPKAEFANMDDMSDDDHMSVDGLATPHVADLRTSTGR